jgi:hypothetical protein
MAAFEQIIHLLAIVAATDKSIADELKAQGLLLLVISLVQSDNVPMFFTKRLLTIVESLSTCGTAHLEEALDVVFCLLESPQSRYCKRSKLLDCLCNIVHATDEASSRLMRWSAIPRGIAVLQTMAGR